VQLEGRIDRMDRLDGGGRVVIDYKSGAVSIASWLGERPDDAQLPLYALALGHEDVDAVAFARMKTGQRAFVGLARDTEVKIRGVTPFQKHKGASSVASTWSGLFAVWEGKVRTLGENFATGDAKVDPKELLLTCRRCDLKSLCRVHERLGALDEGEEEDDASEEGEA
jgi:ATP-dependent helicase/DNAse subunit B